MKIAENNGIAKISEVHPETNIKRNAKQEIEQVAQSQIDTINQIINQLMKKNQPL